MSRTPSQKAALVAANTLPVYRMYAGYKTAHDLGPEGRYHDPANRDWGFAGRVLRDAATDKADGVLARYAGPTVLGGYLDQLSDKFWALIIAHQLAENGEIKQDAFTIPLVRDIGLTAVRPVAQAFGLNSDARTSGKIKMGVQIAATVAACSPIANDHPEIIEGLFDMATCASVISGTETVLGYAGQLRERYGNEPNPAARLVVATTAQIVELGCSA